MVCNFSIEYLFLFIVGKVLREDILPASVAPATLDLSNAVSFY